MKRRRFFMTVVAAIAAPFCVSRGKVHDTLLTTNYLPILVNHDKTKIIAHVSGKSKVGDLMLIQQPHCRHPFTFKAGTIVMLPKGWRVCPVGDGLEVVEREPQQ